MASVSEFVVENSIHRNTLIDEQGERGVDHPWRTTKVSLQMLDTSQFLDRVLDPFRHRAEGKVIRSLFRQE